MSLAWAHYVSMNMNEWDRECETTEQRMQMNGTENVNKWDRECDHKQEREQDWDREHVPDVRDTGREHDCEQAG